MFSARQPGEKGGLPKPLFPDPLPEGAAYDALVQRVKANELIRGKLLSEQGDLALVVLSLDPSVADGPQLETVIDDIRRTKNEDLQDSGLNAQLSGRPGDADRHPQGAGARPHRL